MNPRLIIDPLVVGSDLYSICYICTFPRLLLYYQYIRPLLANSDEDDTDDDVHEDEPLFILKNRKKNLKIGNIERYLSEQLKIAVPCSTKARKIGATLASRSLGSHDNELICTQMSHSMAVHNKNYKATRGIMEAAQAHRAMERVRIPSSAISEVLEKKGRTKWSEEETSEVKKIFSKYIGKKSTPPLFVCVEYEDVFHKDKKQIQDKIKNINLNFKG